MLSEMPNQVAQVWSPDKWCDVHVIVAVSGGADSVAMLRVLTTLKQHVEGRGKLLVAHYNHRWRGADSEADARWVAELANQLGLEFKITNSPNTGDRSEDQLRHERRAFYQQVASDVGARYLATGHTASDQAETVLFRSLRGSGLSGLAGIALFAHLTEATTLARPLLMATRQEVIAYLKSIGQSWREDATNQEVGPTRNWLRKELLPQIEERIPASEAALCRLAKQASEANEVVWLLASRLLDEATIEGASNRSILNCEPFQQAFPLVGREALRIAWQRHEWPEQAMTATHWQSIMSLTAPDSLINKLPNLKQLSMPGGITASRIDNQLVLALD